MRDFTFTTVVYVDSTRGYAVYLPTSLSECVEIYKLYGNVTKSKMYKGKKVVTGDHEVEHHKYSVHVAPLCPDHKANNTRPASWKEYEPIQSGIGPTTHAYWICCPGMTSYQEARYYLTSGNWTTFYKPRHDRVYFYALSPFCYVYHNYYYEASEFTKPASFDKDGKLGHVAYVLYLKRRDYSNPNAWTYERVEETLDSVYNITEIDWSFADSHRKAFDKEVLAKYGKSHTIDWSKDKIHPGLSNLRTVTVGLESAGTSIDVSGQLFTRQIPALTNELLGDLCQSAVDNISYTDINTMAYLKDLKEFASELQAIAKLVKNPLNPKSWASLYLNFQYGSRLTIADTFKLLNGVRRCARDIKKMRKRAWRSSRAMHRSVVSHPTVGCEGSRFANYKVYYKPYDSGIMSYVHKFASWDLLPTSANLWDFIPFSFVIDWFVDIGGLLESIDSAAMATSLDVVGVLYSTKDTYVVNLDLPGQQVVSAEYTVYRRQWSRTLHPPKPRLEASDGFLHNIPQLLAILIQRK